MTSVASYFKDESGVHLTLHISGAEYIVLMDSLLDANVYEASELRELLLAAHAREDRKAAKPREIRFDEWAPSPTDGAL